MGADDVQGLERLEELREAGVELERELEGLRRFLASMEQLVAEVEKPGRRREEEILDLLEEVLDNALQVIDAEDGSLLVPDEATDELVFAIVRGDSEAQSLVGKRVPPRKGIAGWVVTNRRPTIVNNATVDDRFYPDVDAEIDHQTRSILAAPLIGGGRVLGVVEILNRQGGRLFSVANQSLLMLMCRFAGELLHRLVTDVDLSQTLSRSARLAS